MYGPGTGASEEVLAEARRALGLDQPLPIQYVRWLGRVLNGDLGRSVRTKQPVLEMILQRVPATLMLASGSVLIAVVVAFPLGVISGARRGSLLDRISLSVSRLIGLSVPSFALGIVLILIFSVQLRWLPTSGYTNPVEDPLGSLRNLVLPALTQGLHLAGILVGPTRYAVADEMDAEYVRTAKSKGLAGRPILVGHVIKNAMILVLPVVGWVVGYQLAGTVVVETLFSWPGVGRLAYQAITNRDFPLVQGVALLAAVGFLIVNLLVDLTYAALDPRIRLE
jgi:peptide/nickel transport system permease protein